MQNNTINVKGNRAKSRKDDVIVAGKHFSKEIQKDTKRTKAECRKMMALQDALQDPISISEGC